MFAFLAEHREALFPAGMFGDMYRLLADAALRERLASAGQAIRARDGVGRAAAIIENAARD